MKPLIDTINTVDGQFHLKNKETGELATIVTPKYMNDTQGATRDLQQECIAVLTEAGLAPDASQAAQLTAAIKAIIKKQALTATGNLTEIKAGGATAQAAARDSLALGTAATHDVQTSVTDATPGRLMQAGGFGLGGATVALSNAELASPTLNSVLFKQGGGAENNEFGVYGAGIHLLYGGSGDGTQTLSCNLFVDASGNILAEHLAVNNSSGAVVTRNLQKLYGPLNKPTAQDTGAVPVTGGDVAYLENANHYNTKAQAPEGSGALSGQLDSGAPFYASEWAWTPGPGGVYCPLVKGKNIRTGQGFYSSISFGYLLSETQGFASPVIQLCGDGGKSVMWQFNPSTGGFYSSITGEFSSQTDAQARADDAYNRSVTFANGNFCTIAQRNALDSRVAAIENSYVRDFRLGAVNVADGWGEVAPYVVTGSDKTVGDEYMGHVVRRPMQKLVNGTWYNVAWG
jgi:hypothetical protein